MLINDADREAFDEAQGLTMDMISEELTRQGWTTGAIASLEATPSPGGLRWIAKCRGITLQALLREINPRMRPWPSIEARRAHNGPWLALYVESEALINGAFRPDIEVFASFSIHADILFESDDFARFWPCDAQGSKVRWPTDDNGNML